MGLYERLSGIGIGGSEAKLAVHSFMAALGELERGKVTRQQVVDAFALSAGEQAELDALTVRVVPAPESITLGGRIVLTNIGTSFLTLALATVETFGITAFELAAGLNRNGSTGTLEFQLFDVTNTQQIMLLTDTAGAGDKFINDSQVLGSPLGKGIRRIALRARSTVSTDDPIHLGSALILRRLERLSAVELHEVLIMAEGRVPPYDVVANIKARLGV